MDIWPVHLFVYSVTNQESEFVLVAIVIFLECNLFVYITLLCRDFAKSIQIGGSLLMKDS